MGLTFRPKRPTIPWTSATAGLPALNPTPSGGQGPPGPPDLGPVGYSCAGLALGAGPGGPNDPPAPGGPPTGGTVSDAGLMSVLRGSGCWKQVLPCNPATIAPGSVIVLMEVSAISGPFGVLRPRHPPKPVHIGVAQGGGAFRDKPGVRPEREPPSVVDLFGIYLANFSPTPTGDTFWVRAKFGGTSGWIIRYVACYQKTC